MYAVPFFSIKKLKNILKKSVKIFFFFKNKNYLIGDFFFAICVY